jgi:SOS-response transcriptional repressor LexA
MAESWTHMPKNWYLDRIGGDGDLVTVDEEDAADVEDLVVAEVGRGQAEELPHHTQHRRLVLVQPGTDVMITIFSKNTVMLKFLQN